MEREKTREDRRIPLFEKLRRISILLRRESLDPHHRIVVTGIGAVTALGPDLESTWQTMLRGETGIKKIGPETEFNFPLTGVQVAGLIPPSEIKEIINDLQDRYLIKPGALKNRYHLSQVLAIKATGEALADANLLSGPNLSSEIDHSRVGAIIGTCLGGAGDIISSQQKILAGKRAPTDILRIEPERVAAVIPLLFKIQGPTFCVNAACASGNVALIQGIEAILTDNADFMIVGGSEACIDPQGLSLKLFEDINALSLSDDPKTACQPFDIARKGFVMGEGSGIMIIERLDSALRRGAKPYGEFVGWAITNDAFHDTAPSGKGGERAMRLALEGGKKRGLQPEEIDHYHINAHGTATPIGDLKEIQASQTILEEHGLLDEKKHSITSTKGWTGHCIGAAAAVEQVLTLKAMKEGLLPYTFGLETPMPEADALHLIQNTFKEQETDVIANHAFGFGGFNAIVVARKYPER